MPVVDNNGEHDALAVPFYLGRGYGRSKPTAALRRMRAAAAPEDRDSDALLPPRLKPYCPSLPWILDDLHARVGKAHQGEPYEPVSQINETEGGE